MSLLKIAVPLVTDPVLIFFIVLAIILLAPIVLNRLKIPHIIGMIVSGVIIGPYGIGLLMRDASFEIFGQVGILFLMFLAGIEIDMFHLRRNLRRGLGFGLITFGVPMALGIVVSVWVLRFDLLSSVLLASMFTSHTLIAYPIVSRFGLTKSPAVIIAVAGTIIAVVLALIVLAAVVGIHTSGEFDPAQIGWLLLRVAIYALGMIYIYPRLTRWFFRTYSDKITQFIYVLAMMVLASYTAKIIGLEAVLGAFCAGLVLNRYIPNTSGLMNRLEFVGNAIFIPYFLIGVGMLINVGSMVNDTSMLWVAFVMTLGAIVYKWIAAWLTQKAYRMTSIDRRMVFGLSNAHAAASLAVVMIGYGIGIFNEAVLNGTVIMILVTCAVASIATERAAQRMKMEELEREALLDESGEPRKQPEAEVVAGRRMAVAVANPLTVPQLVEFAVMMRGLGRKASEMYAIHVRTDNSAQSRSQGRHALDLAVSTAANIDVHVTPIERYDLNVVTGLVNAFEERDIQEIVIGMHRKATVVDSFFGSMTEQLLITTNKMVVMNRCFIPIGTVTRIVVYVPEKAQFETGFTRWVAAVANLTAQIGCRAIFCCHHATRPYIRTALRRGRVDIRSEYREMDDWDDFLLLANRILDDDLFIVVSARRTSVSFSTAMDELPAFLQKYFSHSNLVLLYPEQFGSEAPMPASVIDPLASDITAQPSELWVRVAYYWRRLIALRKRFTQRHRTRRRIDL